MKGRSRTFYEVLLAVMIAAVIFLPQVIGTTKVLDESAGIDEDGVPMTLRTLEELEAPGTRFGSMMIAEWQMEIEKRFPEGTLQTYETMTDVLAALEADKIDAALGFYYERKVLAGTHPGLAFIRTPFTAIDFGFGLPASDKGRALCKELNTYLSGLRASGEYDRLREKWETSDRDGDVKGDYQFTGEKGTLRIATGGLWTPMTFYYGETLTGEFVEIMNGFCAVAGYKPEYAAVSFTAEMTGLASGTYDVVADAVTYSEERSEVICISQPLMTDEYYLLVKREPVYKEVSKA